MNPIRLVLQKIVSKETDNFTELVEKYTNFVFISPHLDDAVLSCGLLLATLTGLRKKITVLTVFTKCSDTPISPQARSFVRICGYTGGPKLFSDRRNEDRTALNSLNGKYQHLGFIDAAWRTDSAGRAIYKNEKSQFSGQISPKDKKLQNRIEYELARSLAKKRVLVLAPLGFGGHADHLLINKAVGKIAKAVVFWQDYPYYTYINSRKNPNLCVRVDNYQKCFKIGTDYFSKKESLINVYKSQKASIFPTGKIPKLTESYFMLNRSKLF